MDQESCGGGRAGRFLTETVLVLVFAIWGCSSSSNHDQDVGALPAEAGPLSEDVAMVGETAPGPQTAPTLETGVDQAALAAAVTPQVIAFIRATQPSAAADTIQLGRPWGEFEVHKGPRLVFSGSWRMLASMSGNYFAVVWAGPDGGTYKMLGIGSAQIVPAMVAREEVPAVSAALDQGRAGLLRCVGASGYSLVAYEAGAVVDAGQAEILVQPLLADTRFSGLDAGADGIPEMSLAEFDPMLPAE